MAFKVPLGECREFLLLNGGSMKLKLLGGNPLQWEDEKGQIHSGNLLDILGDYFTEVRAVPCW